MLDRTLSDRTETRAVSVSGITIETLERQHSLSDCSFMKIDIEGGEKILVPAIAPFLRRQRPALYLSLHWNQLEQEEVESMLDLLSTIYDYMYDDSLLRAVDKRRVVGEKISSIVCTARPITARQRLAAGRMILSQRLRRILHSAFRGALLRRK
jgi:hypothetical protein